MATPVFSVVGVVHDMTPRIGVSHSSWLAACREGRIMMPTETEANGMANTPNSALMSLLQPSPELAAVVGSAPLPRPEVVSKVWDYIKKHKLQNPQNKREIMADNNLKAVFGGRNKVTTSEMNKYLAEHLR
jgi:upstream activation factor subunit UAF30